MTIHRVWVLLNPLDTEMFGEIRLAVYCTTIAVGESEKHRKNLLVTQILLFISLIIPFYSTCSINYDSRVTSFVSACAPDRHPVCDYPLIILITFQITLFQNKYTIYVPTVSMLINFAIIFYMKFQRRKSQQSQKSKTPSNVQNSQKSRENMMLRQAVFIATYISAYELGNLYVRMYPVGIPLDYSNPWFRKTFVTFRIRSKTLSITSVYFQCVQWLSLSISCKPGRQECWSFNFWESLEFWRDLRNHSRNLPLLSVWHQNRSYDNKKSTSAS